MLTITDFLGMFNRDLQIKNSLQKILDKYQEFSNIIPIQYKITIYNNRESPRDGQQEI